MTFKIGDRVRLTGRSWKHLLDFGTIKEDIVTVTGIDSDGDPTFKTPGSTYCIYTARGADYSAELVTDEWAPAFTEVEETVKVKKVADKPDLVPGDVLVVKTGTGELVTYFAIKGWNDTAYLYDVKGHMVNWDTIAVNAESYRFLFKDGKVV